MREKIKRVKKGIKIQILGVVLLDGYEKSVMIDDVREDDKNSKKCLIPSLRTELRAYELHVLHEWGYIIFTTGLVSSSHFFLRMNETKEKTT